MSFFALFKGFDEAQPLDSQIDRIPFPFLDEIGLGKEPNDVVDPFVIEANSPSDLVAINRSILFASCLCDQVELK